MPGGWIGLRAPSARLSRVSQSEREGKGGAPQVTCATVGRNADGNCGHR